MVIINQNRDRIINFNNVKTIDVIDNGIYLSDDILADKGVQIGKYKTKEILQEIIKKYSSYMQLNGGSAILKGQTDIAPAIFNIPKVYEMPKE